jgi:hypothetical protein
MCMVKHQCFVHSYFALVSLVAKYELSPIICKLFTSGLISAILNENMQCTI